MCDKAPARFDVLLEILICALQVANNNCSSKQRKIGQQYLFHQPTPDYLLKFEGGYISSGVCGNSAPSPNISRPPWRFPYSPHAQHHQSALLLLHLSTFVHSNKKHMYSTYVCTTCTVQCSFDGFKPSVSYNYLVCPISMTFAHVYHVIFSLRY